MSKTAHIYSDCSAAVIRLSMFLVIPVRFIISTISALDCTHNSMEANLLMSTGHWLPIWLIGHKRAAVQHIKSVHLTAAITQYLKREGHSEQHAGSAADTKSQKEKQFSAWGLHNEDLGQQIPCSEQKSPAGMIKQQTADFCCSPYV